MNSSTYLNRFFQEKEIPVKYWQIKDKSGCENQIDSRVVIEFIKNDKQNHHEYASQLRKIDFFNGNVNHFFKFLAKGIVNYGL